ncbi:hemerythrin domain-containing protein [Cellulomonas shaoxiangyii]|uniref:Hemerythrin domain-containing protein n=1 Tax=Cellulomonas shaoxiangyii TaxID=2566013 RepID=A0A4P7SFT0_9CELL|nr:hemerythrin domain-containing protein [Cellulomonas shaoxiangyii]QCB92357.1 hemerythrin domain-containing protein [Cellulomonas shaoxiangyii]TGY86249.1 hemerythrin domain-containing protein [Cellulomonas shaoxiangyii]
MPTDHRSRIVAWDRQLRDVHARLRDSLQIARDAIDDDAASGDRLTSDLRLFCTGFCAALDGHHRSEDAAMFPDLVALDPSLADVVAQLVRDHSVLAQLLGSLQEAVEAGHDAAALHRHLDGIEAIMETHFRYEEKRLLEPLARLTSDRPPREMLGPLA